MKLGDWIAYCDICGQKYLASETTKLSTATGKGGLIVCKHDVDKIDYSLVPYKQRRETLPTTQRSGHTNTENSAPLIDMEDMTYQFYLSASQDDAILMASQDDSWLVVSEPL